ncbi:nitroreductase family protein [Hyperthermus butylicus]|uniref:Nitroreductase n=1 Tax=Hyperthermus butylicus (strain DSM 5456 / JCM 9403 / PLM1-5) TaxID=415426 RepID=A2BLZ9_HYPBU|nr:nitroreductase family protein [Hyperthermus butylicus]ABM81010.1 Nitroreductase [Hyperthermus butylicus DSM 5456]
MAANCVFSLARRRRSIRRYRRDPVNLEDILYAISAALEAPSGANRQPWRFIIVDDEEVKRRLREECERWEKKFHGSESLPGWFKEWLRDRGITWEKPFLTDAPYLIAVAAYKKAPYARESTWLAIGYLLLALEERGLASLTYTPTNPRAAARILGIPEDYTLEALIPVGKLAEEKRKEPRMSIEEAVHYNGWGRRLPKPASES